MRSRDREGRARKSLILGVLCLAAAAAAGAQSLAQPSDAGSWIDSPYRNFGAPQTLIAGRAILRDEADDPGLKSLLTAEISQLFHELYVRQGWRSPFADSEPLRIFVARKEADGVRRVAFRSVEGGRLLGASILLDGNGLTTREIAREVGHQITLATLTGYHVDDGTFLTEAVAAYLSRLALDETDRDAERLAAAAPELSIESSPGVLGRLYVEELTHAAGPAVLRTAWERAAESGEPILPILLASYMERTGDDEHAPLLRFGARLYTTVEPEIAPSRVGLLDLEAGALDAAAPVGFSLRHRTYVPGDGASALRVSWPEDGAAAAAVVRYRDAALPPDVIFLSAGEIHNIALGGVARVDWVVAGGFPGGMLKSPAGIEVAASYPYSGLSAHATAGTDGPRVWWTTATHDGLAGWAVFREEVLPDGRIGRIGPEIIPSSKSASESFAYAYVDAAAAPATFYRYTVWAVTEDGLLSRAFSVTLRSAD